jgi:Tfp pilus assembly protein PilF
MSLLLEALKKAELAKQIAKAGEASGSAPAAAAHAEPVNTRETPQDLARPLEIMANDLPYPDREPPPVPSAGPELSLQQPDLTELEPEIAPYAVEPSVEAGRAQAQQLFQVKEMDYNPRRPFYITLAVLALVGVGYGTYVWWQTRPKQYFVAVPVASSPASAPVAAAPPTQAPAAPELGAVPATPSAAPAPPRMTAAAKAQEIPPIQPVQPPRVRQRPQRAAAAPASPRLPSATTPDTTAQRGSQGLAPIAINRPVVSIDPQIERAYQSFQRNDLAAARDGYQRVLSREPTNRDALLGLAAVALRNGDLDSAESRYLKLLELDPRDTQAVSSLIALHGQLDPVASESRLKTLIANQPEAAPLLFVLGNQYAKQSRWAEAQEAYFKAYSVNPDNADYAFNLAVSLDQLRQKKPALQYYQRALLLSGERAASFNQAEARTRVQELSK